jgi:CDP-paratose 2-epimerase
MSDGRTRTILITGGAGFVGSNLAARLLGEPEVRVRVFDNLSRRGVEQNLAWLREIAGAAGGSAKLEFVRGDVRDRAAVREAAEDADEIYHLAAQVAVTTSIEDPRTDFDVNVLGTFNVLEAARRWGRRPLVLFTSTNKVYGSLEGVPVHVTGRRYVADYVTFSGVTEREPLDFHSPYGCSKGAADQYVRDYARIYDLPAVVFRMSCIAGPRQFGTEDQGWVAHFLYSTLEGRPITIYGDGFQVRDVLHVADLVDAVQAVRQQPGRCAGEIFNLGGGPERAVSVVEMLELIAHETGSEPQLNFADMRPGDQPLYVSDTSKLTGSTGWKAQHTCEETLRSIHDFWLSNRNLLETQRGLPAEAEAEENEPQEVNA